MKPKNERTEALVSGLTVGAEFALPIIVLVFLGHFLGSMLSESAAVLGMVLGAFLGLVLGTYQLVRRVS